MTPAKVLRAAAAELLKMAKRMDASDPRGGPMREAARWLDGRAWMDESGINPLTVLGPAERAVFDRDLVADREWPGGGLGSAAELLDALDQLGALEARLLDLTEKTIAFITKVDDLTDQVVPGEVGGVGAVGHDGAPDSSVSETSEGTGAAGPETPAAPTCRCGEAHRVTVSGSEILAGIDAERRKGERQ